MPGHARQGADDPKAEPLPQTNRWLVGRNHEVELHGAIAQAPRLAEAMLTHGPADTDSPSRRRNHEGGVGHVRTKAGLIGLQDVGADDPAFLLRDVGARRRLEPISQRVMAGAGPGRNLKVPPPRPPASKGPQRRPVTL